MKSMEIYFSDLDEVAQRGFNEIFGNPNDFNHSTMPLFIFEVEDEYDN